MSLLIGFLFGFIGSIPVAGPIALLVFAYGVSDRFRSGLYLAMGGALAESAYAYMAFWGLRRLIDRFPELIPQSRGVGAVVIFVLGLAFVLRKSKEGGQIEERVGRGGSFLLGFTITALNPTFIVTWTAAATTLFSTGLVSPDSLANALPFAIGAFGGIVSWFTLLLIILRRFKGRFSKQTLDRVVRVVGVALIGLSLWFAWSFVRYLFLKSALRAGRDRTLPAAPMTDPSTSLFTGVFSVVPTRRRRFFWAAWWSAPPSEAPFRKPDASSGGARSREEAKAQAEKAAGLPLLEIASKWAGAWTRVVRGQAPWPKARAARHGERSSDRVAGRPVLTTGSRAWARRVLGVSLGATPEEIRRAFRQLALTTHPDRGGDAASFIDAKRAHDVAMSAARAPRRRRRRR